MAAATPPAKAPPAFELKSTTLSLLAFTLKTADLAVLGSALQSQTADSPGLYEHEAVVVDLSQVQSAAVDGADATPDLPALLGLLRSHGLVPLGVKGGSAAQTAAALECGLVEAPDLAPAPLRSAKPTAPVSALAPAPQPGSESSAADAAPAAPTAEAPQASIPMPAPDAAPAPASTNPAPTMVVSRPLRSGQQVYARGGDLVMLAAVNDGAEVIADGSIHVYAPLRGRAVAGARGDTQARIFATHMQPQLVSIAGTYLTIEDDLPADIKGRPAQVRLEVGRLVFEPLARTGGRDG
ncbi:MAG: septum site-determining protein MinC [Rubrivivax sp.]